MPQKVQRAVLSSRQTFWQQSGLRAVAACRWRSHACRQTAQDFSSYVQLCIGQRWQLSVCSRPCLCANYGLHAVSQCASTQADSATQASACGWRPTGHAHSLTAGRDWQDPARLPSSPLRPFLLRALGCCIAPVAARPCPSVLRLRIPFSEALRGARIESPLALTPASASACSAGAAYEARMLSSSARCSSGHCCWGLCSG